MNDRKSAKQIARYKSLITDGRNLLRRAWRLERSLWITAQLKCDLSSKKDLKVDREFIQVLRSEILRSICIQTRTMLDDSQDAIGLPGLIGEVMSEIGLISEQRWKDAAQFWETKGRSIQ